MSVSSADCDRLAAACETVARQWRSGHPPGHDAIVELHRALKRTVPGLVSATYPDYLGMKLALDCIAKGLADTTDGDGDYHPARAFLDSRGIYNGDLYDLRVLYAVCKAVLEDGKS